MFQAPATEFFAAKDFNGHLVMVENIGQPFETQTNFGMNACIRADVTVLTAEGGAKVFPQTNVFGAALVGTLSRAVPGSPVLGRIAQSATAKPGQSPAWVLNPFAPEDAAYAEQYLASRSAQTFQAAAAVAPVAPAAPVAPIPQAVAPSAFAQSWAPGTAPAAPVAAPPVAAPVAAAPVALPTAPPVAVAAPLPTVGAAVATPPAGMTVEQFAQLPLHVQQALMAAGAAQPAEIPF